MVNVLLLTVTILFPPRVTVPVPKLRFCVPVKEKSPPHVWVLFLEFVMAAAVVLSKVPPLMVKAPVPIAVALLKFNVPEVRVVRAFVVFAPARVRVGPLRVVPPVYEFIPLDIIIPDPTNVSGKAPLMAPPNVSGFEELVVIWLAAVMAIAPVPMFKGLLPVKVKAPPHDWGLFTRVLLLPLVLSMVVPLPMISEAAVVPTAEALFKFNVPAVKVKLPV